NFTVCHTGPANNICTLRAAIMNANRHPGGAIIHLPAGTYVIQIPGGFPDDDLKGDLNISNTVTIVGAGAASTIVDGSGLSAIFIVHFGDSATISGLTLRNGRNTNIGFGGAIEDQGHLTLSDSVLSNNNGLNAGGGLFVGPSISATAVLNRVTL